MSVTHPRGFRATGLAAGIKSSGAADLALVVSDGPRHTAAGVFTSNRVLAAVGTTGAAFDPLTLDVAINGVTVCRAGGLGEDRSAVDMTGREVHVLVDLHAGQAAATVWTNDLTHAYVHENSAYSS